MADAAFDEVDVALQSFERSVPALEEQVKRLKEVAQKLDPVEARGSAEAVVASVLALAREIRDSRTRCGGLAAEGLAPAQVETLSQRAERFAQRIDKVSAQATQLRNQAQLKVSRAMEALRVQVCYAVLEFFARTKRGTEEVFGIADVDRDGKVGREEFFALVQDCEPSKFSLEQLGRLFDYFDEDEAGKLDREDFDRLFRIFYKVSRPKVEIYQTMGISQGRKVRALDIDEVVELLEGPVKESNGSIRIRCRAMKDGVEGWTVEKGNTGTAMLSQCRIHYKVVQKTVLTTCLRLDECRTIRELDENELLEVQIWEQLDKYSGVKRLKGKTNKDGLVGWVTTITNTGTKMLEIV